MTKQEIRFIRTKQGSFHELKYCKDRNEVELVYENNSKLWYINENDYNEVVMIKDSPLKLLKPRDLIFDDEVPSIIKKLVQEKFGVDYLDTDGFKGATQNITEIYTRNLNNDYVCQWRK